MDGTINKLKRVSTLPLDRAMLTVSPIFSPCDNLRPHLDESSPTKNGKIFPLCLQNMFAFVQTTESAVVSMPGQESVVQV